MHKGCFLEEDELNSGGCECYDPNPRVRRVSDKVVLFRAWVAGDSLQPLDQCRSVTWLSEVSKVSSVTSEVANRGSLEECTSGGKLRYAKTGLAGRATRELL
jgi:hypothetical protein